MTAEKMIRLIADEGKVLTDGETTTSCVDVCPADDVDKWTEIDAPVEEETPADSDTVKE